MKLALIFCLCLFIATSSYAQTVIELKSGRIVKGELVEKTEEYIKLNIYGVNLTYWMDEIKHISSQPESDIVAEEKITSDGQRVEELSNTEDAQLIKKVIERFFVGFDKNNAAAALREVSESFYNPETKTDYAKFKLFMEKLVASISSNVISSSRNNFEIKIVEINNNKAKTEVTFDYKAFALETASWVNTPYHHYINLQKEDGEWKILQYSGFDFELILNPKL